MKEEHPMAGGVFVQRDENLLSDSFARGMVP